MFERPEGSITSGPGGTVTSTLIVPPAHLSTRERRGSSVRQINESIESLTPLATGGGSASRASSTHAAPSAPPLAFRWRGRRYVVGSVLAHWVETGAWWRAPADQQQLDQPPADPERWLWRVEAGSRDRQTGVFDLCLDRDRERWSLHAIYD